MSEPSIVWRPQPGPQTALLQCPVEDVFYGGARGGGKTDGLLGDFMQHAGRWGEVARGILFRRSIPELDEVIARSRVLFGALGWRYTEQKHVWTAPNGATLLLRYLDSDADAENYQGHQYTWMAFDELGNWPTSVGIDRLWACLRSPAPGVPKSRRCTGNPGGVGHAWVKKRYRLGADECRPFDPFTYVPLASRPDLTITAVFIPARLEDNALLMENDPGYEARLAASSGGHEVLFNAWRKGVWDVPLGAFFDIWDLDAHTYDPLAPPWMEEASQPEIPEWWPKWIGLDFGFGHASAAYWCASDTSGRVFVYRELVRRRLTPQQLGEELRDRTGSESIGVVYLSHDAFAQRTSVRTIADELHDATGPLPFPTMADRDRIGGAVLIYSLLRERRLCISHSCSRLIEVMPTLIHDPNNTDDVLKVDGDDPYDGLRYALKSRARVARVPIEMQMHERTKGLDLTNAMMMRRRLEAEELKAHHPISFAMRWRR
jgi:hypothetical protein